MQPVITAKKGSKKPGIGNNGPLECKIQAVITAKNGSNKPGIGKSGPLECNIQSVVATKKGAKKPGRQLRNGKILPMFMHKRGVKNQMIK